jgi:hypothetical protein
VSALAGACVKDPEPAAHKEEKVPKVSARRAIMRVLIVEDDEPRVLFFERAFRAAEVRWLEELGDQAPEISHVWARAATAAIGVLNRDSGRVYAGVLLDRDLNNRNLTSMDRHKTGEHVVEVVVHKLADDVPVLVHSTNQSGGPRMVGRLDGAGYPVSFVPFYNLTERRMAEWLDEVLEAWIDFMDE